MKEILTKNLIKRLIKNQGIIEEEGCPCGSGLYSDIEYDARGISLGYMCEKCKKDKLKKYRRDVLEDSNYEADEPFDEDYY